MEPAKVVKEVIVVEGKNDVAAVKRAVKAEILITGGFSLPAAKIRQIRKAQQMCGVIVLTDPDTVGERIRKKLNEIIPGCKNAFLPREDAIKDGDVGIENASPEAILAALSRVHTWVEELPEVFTMADLSLLGLTGNELAAQKRAKVGKILGLGYTNSKQFLNRLNHYGITREEFLKACEQAELN
ncbi:MAG TPA: ribonuclease M5 [Bacillota bacterium]|nr:ribonuclease M5 [Bacillota bacterium]